MGVEDLLWEALEDASCCGAIHAMEADVVLAASLMRCAVLDEVYEALRLELKARNAEVDRDRAVLTNPYHTHEHIATWQEDRGRARGVCVAMEIVEAMRQGDAR